MTYENEEQARLIRQSSKQAIALAMAGRWREAVVANKGIIENYPNDVDAYNRLGRAYMELGEYPLAREAYSLAKGFDPHNVIADKNLRRLSDLGEVANLRNESFHGVEPQQFIEETGKAGVVGLYNLAPRGVMAKMVAGDRVYLKTDDSNLVVENSGGEELGQVDPKYAQRLTRLMKGGNRYTAAVISSSEEMMAIIIREVYQHPSQAEQLSFPARGLGSLRPYVSDTVPRRHLEPGVPEVKEADYATAGGDEAEAAPGESIEDSEEEEG
ncbi:MAG: tetratricopeptide repeat protein [Dehalococcoidales bacterium]|jgi:tetratricopeptide (TPR) repeat protein